MWRTIYKSCSVILLVVSAALGLALYTIHVYTPLKNNLLNQLNELWAGNYDIELQIIATFLIIVPLLALLAMLRMRRKREPLVYHTAEGPVVIEMATLGRFVKSVIKAYDQVRFASVKTVEDNRKVNVIARVYLNDSQPVASVVSEIQLAVRRRVQEAFGLDLLRDIRIEVARLSVNTRHLRKLLGINDSKSLSHTTDESDNDSITPAEYQAINIPEDSK